MTSRSFRCAIYTRKSSEEGLQQEFNSLDAQREACRAYVLSQAGEGWTALAKIYDDGGYSGGSMERPALRVLLEDIAAGQIDIVVVYKVDRLTRSLTDFGKIVEAFDARGVSFVSVTQAFNTTTSMGRLTLNVLLSFAQFEREVTGERIRDKIAASKAKGLWMGGNVPMGYEASGRTLKVADGEAKTVRDIYRRYLELGSVHKLHAELRDAGIKSKTRIAKNGAERGGGLIARGALFHMLANRTYLGEVPHKGRSYPGQHPAIVDQAIFDEVQALLLQNAGPKKREKAGLAKRVPRAPLTGLIHDDHGERMSPISAKGSAGQRYRYYASSSLQRGAGIASAQRVAAPVLEDLVLDCARELGVTAGENWSEVRSALTGVRVGMSVEISFRRSAVPRMGQPPGCTVREAEDHIVVTAPPIEKRGGQSRILSAPSGVGIERPRLDRTLLRALARAEAWKRTMLAEPKITMARIGEREGLAESYVQRVLRLAFLAPDLKRSILDGRQPPGLSLERFMRSDLPLAWPEQRRLFA